MSCTLEQVIGVLPVLWSIRIPDNCSLSCKLCPLISMGEGRVSGKQLSSAVLYPASARVSGHSPTAQQYDKFNRRLAWHGIYLSVPGRSKARVTCLQYPRAARRDRGTLMCLEVVKIEKQQSGCFCPCRSQLPRFWIRTIG